MPKFRIIATLKDENTEDVWAASWEDAKAKADADIDHFTESSGFGEWDITVMPTDSVGDLTPQEHQDYAAMLLSEASAALEVALWKLDQARNEARIAQQRMRILTEK